MGPVGRPLSIEIRLILVPSYIAENGPVVGTLSKLVGIPPSKLPQGLVRGLLLTVKQSDPPLTLFASKGPNSVWGVLKPEPNFQNLLFNKLSPLTLASFNKPCYPLPTGVRKMEINYVAKLSDKQVMLLGAVQTSLSEFIGATMNHSDAMRWCSLQYLKMLEKSGWEMAADGEIPRLHVVQLRESAPTPIRESPEPVHDPEPEPIVYQRPAIDNLLDVSSWSEALEHDYPQEEQGDAYDYYSKKGWLLMVAYDEGVSPPGKAFIFWTKDGAKQGGVVPASGWVAQSSPDFGVAHILDMGQVGRGDGDGGGIPLWTP